MTIDSVSAVVRALALALEYFVVSMKAYKINGGHLNISVSI